MSESKNYFTELASIDVSKHVEKKGRFSYLSWSWAVDQLLKKHPDATWRVVRFDGLPYMKTEVGYFVEVEVTVNNITRSQIHPVLDNYNKPITKPTSFQINTSIQRCLAKAIALHGLGLYIYSGEDIPQDDDPKTPRNRANNIPSEEQKRRAELANEQIWKNNNNVCVIRSCQKRSNTPDCYIGRSGGEKKERFITNSN
ncbi:DUF1071 domain-containing protein [Bacillus cytotoxicus]|uniref:DUF1071 domain-containing protein n=1 Tax=Bacillus cytotoxicus TaxID=580165 RepID=UPI0030BA1353